MTRTPFSTENATFSERAHKCAQVIYYPLLFGPANKLEFETVVMDTQNGSSTRHQIYDAEMAVDRIISVQSNNFMGPLKFTVQERFRRHRWCDKQDVTITTWNNNSNQPSELYKIKSDYLVYGYMDETERFLYEVIAVQMQELKRALILDQVDFWSGTNPRSNQDFMCVMFDELKRLKLSVSFHHWRYTVNDDVLMAQSVDKPDKTHSWTIVQ